MSFCDQHLTEILYTWDYNSVNRSQSQCYNTTVFFSQAWESNAAIGKFCHIRDRADDRPLSRSRCDLRRIWRINLEKLIFHTLYCCELCWNGIKVEVSGVNKAYQWTFSDFFCRWKWLLQKHRGSPTEPKLKWRITTTFWKLFDIKK